MEEDYNKKMPRLQTFLYITTAFERRNWWHIGRALTLSSTFRDGNIPQSNKNLIRRISKKKNQTAE